MTFEVIHLFFIIVGLLIVIALKLTVYLNLLLLFISTSLTGQVLSLKGDWKFHIDDKSMWSAANYDDTKWEKIYAPSPWEEEGFNGYDGFAWYRRKFDGRKLNKNESYYLGLGFIDDTDEAYVNGKLVGFSGSCPPKFKTAYNSERRYALPNEIINFEGENTIAIRVFDVTQGGGIIQGNLGIFRLEKNKNLLIDLQGIWLFTTNKADEVDKNESDWTRLMVPGPWEHQGQKYDGFAWYKRTFTLPDNMPTEDLVLILGRIDDFDKTYVNGQMVGSTNDHKSFGGSSSYLTKRVYTLPATLLKKKGPNTIEVLVEDIGNIGGIYEGPVGITTRANYNKYFK